MKTNRRRHTSSAVFQVPVSQTWDVETEILSAIDARQKLQSAIPTEKQKYESADLGITRECIAEINENEAVNVDYISQKIAAAKVAADRAKQGGEALDAILARVNARIDQLKTGDPNSVTNALTKKIETLEKSLTDKSDTTKDIEAQINVLKDEL